MPSVSHPLFGELDSQKYPKVCQSTMLIVMHSLSATVPGPVREYHSAAAVCPLLLEQATRVREMLSVQYLARHISCSGDRSALHEVRG